MTEIDPRDTRDGQTDMTEPDPHAAYRIRLGKYNKGGISNAEPEYEFFPYDHPEVAMMTALTYGLLDMTREFGSYEVVDCRNMLLIRVTPRWMYNPENPF